MELFVPISLNILLVVAIYLAEKMTKFNKLSYLKKQIIIGVLFGIVSCFASDFGVYAMDTKANVRDAAPLSAGLIFGGPAGIIAGIIGGLYRWFSVYWGGGYTTQLACAVATILAGFMAAALRKFMFDNKKPTWSYAIAITVFCEVVHMLLIFITNMNNSVEIFKLVRSVTVPMILGNVAAVGLSLVAVYILSRDDKADKKRHEHIAETFQRWLLICIMLAFIITSVFTFLLQGRMATLDTHEVFRIAINDVITDVREKSDAYLLDITMKIKADYEANPYYSLNRTATKHGVREINIVNEDGWIRKSTDEHYVGEYNMYDHEQSREFMVLVEEEDVEYYVQEYGPIGIDNTVLRKYAGVKLDDGGFIQVGYSSDQFHFMLDEFVIDVTKNRHVGSNGFIVVCDEKLNLVTNDEYNGMHVSTVGIKPTEEMLLGESATGLCEAQIGENMEEYIYVFTFVEGYCIIAAMPQDEAMFMRDASIYTSVFMEVIIFATLFVFIYVLIKRVIINNLKKINSTLAQITDGNLNVTVDVRSNEEFASLSDDINSTVSTLKRYIAEAAARIDKELEYAKQIQLSALPTNFPVDEDYTISAQMIAAKEVGGDFYDFYKLDDENVAFLVADVSGKGIPAAMFMMTAKTIIKDLAESGLSVNDIFTKANAKLCENNESGMFVTAWMGILNTKTGKLQFSNAGHNPPLIKKNNGEFEYLRSKAGFVLAGMEGIRYRVNETELCDGDRIFLYTDGVPEATNAENKLYGEERLLNFMNENINATTTELLPLLKANIDVFVGDAPQFDDITMLVLERKASGGGVTEKEMTFPARTDALDDVLGFVTAELESCGCAMKTVNIICVAIEEVFVNVANYAYGDGDGDAVLKLSYDEKEREMTFRLSDKGKQFDPLKKPDPDITLSAEEREIGGLGIFITKKTMDSVTYAYENGENVLTMIKKI